MEYNSCQSNISQVSDIKFNYLYWKICNDNRSAFINQSLLVHAAIFTSLINYYTMEPLASDHPWCQDFRISILIYLFQDVALYGSMRPFLNILNYTKIT